MKQSILKFEVCTSNAQNIFRTIFKTQHSRMIYLSLKVNDSDCTILDCFYIDRNQGKIEEERYSSKPKKLQTFQCRLDELLSVIATELDKKFYGVEFIHDDNANLSLEEYLKMKTSGAGNKYHFLIMVGDGEDYNGIPLRLCTRLKNKLYRLIYIELEYYNGGKGVVRQCYYYDRKYKRQNIKITPHQLTSCFFPYTREGILNLLNHEICCNFTHMIVTSGIDLDSNTTPLCGTI
ncbi:MAG: hypothetical protein IJN54_16135 [Lachnospiraceae bacterium]|nr:hypothetical protein [Lachnospiraceae bacterium]